MDKEMLENGGEQNNVNEEEQLEKEIKLSKTTGFNLEKLEKEIRSGFREVEYEGKKYRICLPTIKEDDLLTSFKGRKQSEALKDKDSILKDEVIKNLKERGIWDDTKDRKERELRDQYSKCLADLFAERSKIDPDKDRLLELQKERLSIDIDLAILTETKQNWISSSAEARIEEQVTKYKSVLCIRDEDGNRIWQTIEDFDNSTDKGLVNTLTSEALYFWAGLDQSMFAFAPIE
jgi:hypothetical protein